MSDPENPAKNRRALWGSLGIYALVVIASLAARAVLGKDGEWRAVPFVLLVAGIVGAYAGLTRHARRPSAKDVLFSLLEGGVACAVILPIFLLCHFGASKLLTGIGFQFVSPEKIWTLLAVQIIAVAIPEEFFFRCTLQPGLDAFFGKRWKLFGIEFGWGVIVVSVLFALAHVVMRPSAMSALTFFPSLVFGLLYVRRGSIAGAVFCHAAFNVSLICFPIAGS